MALSQTLKKTRYNIIRTAEDIVIDGKNNEKSWTVANIATDFTQFRPDPDLPPAQKSEVKLIYDDEAIYVFADLQDTSPDSIMTDLSVRDDTGNADWFAICFDTYTDGQNGLGFFVTAAGVQLDSKFSDGDDDSTWDAVWESKILHTDKGWQVEMRIPYAALRFADVEVQEWGLQFIRNIRRHREQSFWNRVDPEIDGNVIHFGRMDGLKNIKSPIRLSLNPFVIGYVNHFKDPSIDQVHSYGTAYGIGMDLKYGINDAFTLDMTLIPDFGQTQSDNQVLNLSPFEQAFEERRPFFTEGIELFNKGNLFYSRRVGDTPFDYFGAFNDLEDDETVIENENTTQLYNAFKISGRTSRGTGVGFFNAVEASQDAIIENAQGERRTYQTNPLTNYNVTVIDQNLPNNSFVTLINTNVYRKGDAYDANTTGGLVNLKTKDQKWGVRGFGAVSQQFRTEETDRGFAYNLEAEKLSGKWTYGVEHKIESDTYNPNDLGLLFSPNEKSYGAYINYNEYEPEKYFNRWDAGLSVNYARLYNPDVYDGLEWNFRSFFFTKGFNAFGLFTGGRPLDRHNYFEPRTGDFETYSLVKAFQFFGFFVSTDYRKTLALDLEYVNGNSYQYIERYRFYRIAPRWRVNDKLILRYQARIELNKNQFSYVNRNGYDGPIAGLSDDGILYGLRERYNVESLLTANYVFDNNTALTFRLRHYTDEVNWPTLGQLNDKGWYDPIAFDGIGDDGVPVFDQNVNIFNIDMQFTKRFAPGSDIILVWKQQIFGSDQEFQRDYFRNLSGLGAHPQSNSISLRIVYFIDYQTIR